MPNAPASHSARRHQQTRPVNDDPSPQYDERQSACKRGYGRQWRKARIIYLQENPYCASCQRLVAINNSETDRNTPLGIVDHIVPHLGDMELFWTEDNWQTLCKPCHDRKTLSGK